jgi:hypothetical protein
MASIDKNIHRRVRLPALLCAALLGGVLAPAAAQEARIYSCVDAKGRRLTADRPIVECLDREQQKYGTGGTVRGTLGPSLTGEERAAAEARQRKADEDRLRQAEERRRDRLLLQRYPDQAAHDKERAQSLAPLDAAIASGKRHADELVQQRKGLEAEAKAAGNDPVKAPRARRALEQNEQNQAAQLRLVNAQVEDRERISRRFDEELERLRRLWAQAAVPVGAASRPRS